MTILKTAAKYKWVIASVVVVALLAWAWRCQQCNNDDQYRGRRREGFFWMLPAMGAVIGAAVGSKKGGGGGPRPYVPPPGPPVVAVYKDSNFGGMDKFYGVGEYSDLGSWNDAISSLRIPSGLKVTLYQKTGFSGKQLTLLANDHTNLSHFYFDNAGTWVGRDVCGSKNSTCWNDTASSMKVYNA